MHINLSSAVVFIAFISAASTAPAPIDTNQPKRPTKIILKSSTGAVAKSSDKYQDRSKITFDFNDFKNKDDPYEYGIGQTVLFKDVQASTNTAKSATSRHNTMIASRCKKIFVDAQNFMKELQKLSGMVSHEIMTFLNRMTPQQASRLLKDLLSGKILESLYIERSLEQFKRVWSRLELEIALFRSRWGPSRVMNELGLSRFQDQDFPYFIILTSIFETFIFTCERFLDWWWVGNSLIFADQVSIETLIRMGANWVPCMKPQTSFAGTSWNCRLKDCSLAKLCAMKPSQTPNQWGRFISPIFLHSDGKHLRNNLLSQLIYSWKLEASHNWWKIAFIYYISGFFGSLLSANYRPDIVASVGASGAVFGLLGAKCADLLLNFDLRKQTDLQSFVIELGKIAIGTWTAASNVDHLAHLGGFIMGFLASLIVLPSSILHQIEENAALILRAVLIFCAIMLHLGQLMLFYLKD